MSSSWRGGSTSAWRRTRAHVLALAAGYIGLVIAANLATARREVTRDLLRHRLHHTTRTDRTPRRTRSTEHVQRYLWEATP